MKDFIKQARLKQKLSIAELSKLSNVSNRTIENWEYRGIEPTLDNYVKVLNALGYELKIIKKE